MKNLFLLALIITLVSCSKENPIIEEVNTNTKALEMIKEYYPDSGINVKEKVVDFLAKSRSLNPMKNNSEDIEFNEAVWMMEGASNYLMNVNLDLSTNAHKILDIDLPVFTENGEYIVKETDVFDQFNYLQSQVTEYEIENDKSAQIADYAIKSVNENSILLHVSVLFGENQDEETNCYYGFRSTSQCENKNMELPYWNYNYGPSNQYESIVDWVYTMNQNYLCGHNTIDYPDYDVFFTNVRDIIPFIDTDGNGSHDGYDYYYCAQVLNQTISTEAMNATFETIRAIMCEDNFFSIDPLSPYNIYNDIGNSGITLNTSHFSNAYIKQKINLSDNGEGLHKLIINNLMTGIEQNYYED